MTGKVENSESSGIHEIKKQKIRMLVKAIIFALFT